MASLLDKDIEELQSGGGAASNYKFSCTKIDALGAAEYTLATIVLDTSGSVASYSTQLEMALATIYKACEKSDRKENLMLRVTQFNTGLSEIHGFRLLGSINPSQEYSDIIHPNGYTCLFDAMDEAIAATTAYGNKLTGSDFLANGIVVVVTDGQNNHGSIMQPGPVKKSIEAARKAENLESLLIILVGVTNDDDNLDTYLKDVKDGAGVDQYVSIGKATPGKIAKLADFVSQSISSTSKALQTGSASVPITPKF